MPSRKKKRHPGWSPNTPYDGDVVKRPLGIADVALFFGRGTEWVRQREMYGLFRYPDGSKVVPERTDSYRRVYTLSMMRAMADSLMAENKLTPGHYETVIRRIEAFE